jgi:hypothetical protein
MRKDCGNLNGRQLIPEDKELNKRKEKDERMDRTYRCASQVRVRRAQYIRQPGMGNVKKVTNGKRRKLWKPES